VAVPFSPSFLLLPVAVWVGTGGVMVLASRRLSSPALLRLGATFAALWALLATTFLVGVLSWGLGISMARLASSPLLLLEPSAWRLWVYGGLGALAILTVAFSVNQLVGRGLLRFLETRELGWPLGLPAPTGRVGLYAFRSEGVDAFSFTLAEWDSLEHAVHRHELILLSDGLIARLSPEELEAVVAHELGHVRDLDARYLTFVRTFSRLMRWDPVLSYLAATLTSREEYRADDEATRMTGRPRALARALYKALDAPEGRPRPLAGPGLLGARGRRGRSEALQRIERLLALADSVERREGRRE